MALLVPDLPPTVPVTLIAPVQGIVPPRVTLVTLPDVRLNVAVFGLDAVAVTRQVAPNDGSLTDHLESIMLSITLFIEGRVPVNPLYCTCQGSVAVRTVELPLGHGPTLALVMKPTRAPAVFVVVLVCIEPSTVKAHLIVLKPPMNSADVQVDLIARLDTLRVLALATPTSANSTKVALTTAIDNFTLRIQPPSASPARRFAVLRKTHIRVTVRALSVLDLPPTRKLPFISPVQGIVPPSVALVTLPDARLNVAVFGLDALDASRQVLPNDGSLISHFAPIMFATMEVISGRMPANELY